jgi:hypothetical protein
MVMKASDTHGIEITEALASLAVQRARASMPKISGRLASTLTPVFGDTYWGIYFPDRKAWYLEQGTSPFTMNSLAGKIIPMWVDDPDGSVAKKQGRKAQTRMTIDGRRQTKIFRKAAEKGSRKQVKRRGRMVSVPRSYPGAPGRISNRSSGGMIGSPNGGVRWRHPGIDSRHYMNRAMYQAALEFGIMPTELYLIDAATFSSVTKG